MGIFISFPTPYFYLHFIRKFQNEEGMDVAIPWALLYLNILISHDTNLAALTIDKFSQLFCLFSSSRQ